MLLELHVLGSAGSSPLPKRPLSSFFLRREGEGFIFDCGEGTQLSIKEYGIKLRSLKAVFITHLHADHITGLPGILMLLTQTERDFPLYIIGPKGIKAYVEMNYETLTMYRNYDIEIREIEDTTYFQEVFSSAGYKVYSFPLKHTKECVGYTFCEDMRPGVFLVENAIKLNVPKGELWAKLQSGQDVVLEDGRVISSDMVLGEKRPGRKFSLITDTIFVNSAVNYIKNSDILVCEGMFLMDLYEEAKKKMHLTAIEGAMYARLSESKKVILTHFSSRYTDRTLQELLEEARGEFKESFLAKKGDVYPIKMEG